MDSTAIGRPRVCILWQGGVSCPVSVAWHSCVVAYWSTYHCYKQAPSRYDLRSFKAPLNPNKQNPIYDFIEDAYILLWSVSIRPDSSIGTKRQKGYLAQILRRLLGTPHSTLHSQLHVFEWGILECRVMSVRHKFGARSDRLRSWLIMID